PPRSTLFPYTTLFRSSRLRSARAADSTALPIRCEDHWCRRSARAADVSGGRCTGGGATSRRAGCDREGPPGGGELAPGLHLHGRSEEHTSELQSRENL